jgi:hypothetical protein
MKTHRIPYKPSYYLRIRDFLSESARGSLTPHNWWIDRWNFTSTVSCAMHGTPHEDWARRIGIWEDGAGIVALALTEGEGRGEAFIATGPEELPAPLLEEIFDFILERYADPMADGGRMIFLRIDPRFPLRETMATRRGFKRAAWSEPLAWLPIGSAPSPEPPEGYSLAEAPLDPRGKALLHAQAFGYADKAEFLPRSEEGFRRLAGAPDYRPELDLTLLGPDGEGAAFTGFWYDARNRWGIVEPAGTAPEHRRKGLGRALIGEGSRRLAGLGARGLWVGSDQPYYLAVGFEVLNRWPVWEYAERMPRTTSEAMRSPAEAGTKAAEPGTERRPPP